MTIAGSWQYRAATAAGDLVEGVVQATSQQEAVEELRRRALVPVSLSEGAPGAPGRGRWRASRADSVAAAVRTLSAMVSGGATLERALRFAAAQAGHPEVAAALEGVRAEVLGGQSLAATFQSRTPLFGSLAPALVRAGEESGTLDAALGSLADHLDEARELRARLQGALLYPALLGAIAGLGVLVLLGFVVPRFVAMLDASGATLPLSTRVLVATSEWVTRFGLAAVVVTGLAAGAFRSQLRDPEVRARWHALRLRLPLAGRLELEAWTGRFARTLAVLLEGGTPLLSALRISRDGVANDFLRRQLDQAIGRVERGERVAAALDGILPPLAVQLLAIGEESASLAPAAARIATQQEQGVQRSLRQAVGLLEPALIVVFGGLVGFVALAMLQAIYSINASLP